MKNTFKVLVSTDEDIIKYIGRYIHLSKEVVGFSSTPQLMQPTATFSELRKVYPKMDFTNMDLITVEIKEL
jgi:hypothetical protein